MALLADLPAPALLAAVDAVKLPVINVGLADDRLQALAQQAIALSPDVNLTQGEPSNEQLSTTDGLLNLGSVANALGTFGRKRRACSSVESTRPYSSGSSRVAASRSATIVGASRAEPTITHQPALASSPQPRPAPTPRALPSEYAAQRGPFWMPIRGPDPVPIDRRTASAAIAC